MRRPPANEAELMIIQELKPSRHAAGRWLAVLEDGSILRVGENEVLRFSLYRGKELSPEEAEEIQDCARHSGLKEKALNLLARKPMSRRELERKLLEWEASEEEACAVCARMEELGFLDDSRYAAQVVRHYSAKGCGVGKLRDELFRRGVPRELWQEALAQAEDSAGAIDAFLAKKLRGEHDPKAVKKAADALARRGYPWSEISEGLRRYGMDVED